jgi:hypothetical protein
VPVESSAYPAQFMTMRSSKTIGTGPYLGIFAARKQTSRMFRTAYLTPGSVLTGFGIIASSSLFHPQIAILLTRASFKLRMRTPLCFII